MALNINSRRHLIEVRDLGQHATELQISELLEASNSLRRRFKSWEKLQAVHMPTVTPHQQSLGEEASATSKNVKELRLFLPSEIVGKIPLSDQLAKHEFQYRFAQAHTTLQDLKEEIIVRTHMINSKKKYSHGTRQMTRSNAKIQSTSQSIRNVASKYRTIRQKLLSLLSVVGDLSWTGMLKELDDGDIRGLTSQEAIGEKDRASHLGEGHRRFTWIWTVVKPKREKGVGDGDKSVSIVDASASKGREAEIEGADSDVGRETDSDSKPEYEDEALQRVWAGDKGKGRPTKR
ncbi:hypothetical protein H1R20_g12896, partial [Candolleomyces eurysporus]